MSGTSVSSPPPLTGGGSSSSQSSSTVPSSLHLDEHGLCNDLSDFEEIGLSDDHEQIRQPPIKPIAQKPLKQKQSMTALSAIRDVTHAHLSAKKPPFPSVQTTNLDTRSLNVEFLGGVPQKPQSRKLTSQSSPAVNKVSQMPPPSPGLYAMSPSLTGVPNGRRASPHGPHRRASWQAARKKTAEEIEKEYDNDSDDDVPDDTIFWNVPLSPRSSKTVSGTPSPERESSGGPPINGRKENNKEHRESCPAVPVSSHGGEAIRGRPQEARSKSWNDAVQELGYEARELSEALERHAEEGGSMEDVFPQRSASSARRKSPPRTSIVELPPIQMQNGMIDPLPISKEKEAVLSRTRPSWLPPKSKAEERKHLKEYQQMMRRSQEAERKRVEKERAEADFRQRQATESHNVWEKSIIPNWSKLARTAETRELWWKGVPTRCRGSVWRLAFGNHLSVGKDTLRLALARAEKIEQGVKRAPNMYPPKERELFTSIRRDVKNTFPELRIFQVGAAAAGAEEKRDDMVLRRVTDVEKLQEKGPLHQSLLDVLMAYSMYRSDVGYVYGTHVVAGLLLLNLSPEQAFITLANVLNRPLPLAFFTQDEGAMSRAYSLFLKAFAYKLPSLHRHVHIVLKIPPSAYLEPMFLTLFTLNCSPDIASRIWDVYCFEGDAFLVRTAVAVLMVLESKLYGSREEVLKVLGWSARGVWELGSEDEFMAVVRSAGKEERGQVEVDAI